MEIPEGYVESVAPELFKFERVGDRLAGILTAIQKVRLLDEDTSQYKLVVEVLIETERGAMKFRPGFDVKSKLRRRMIGNQVLIKYLGTDPERGKDGNALKVFGVYWQPKAEGTKVADGPPQNKLDDGTYITDEDIPF